MHRFFYIIYKKIQRQKWVALLALALLLGGALFFAFQIEFEEDISRVLPKNEKTDVTARVLQQLDFSDKIAVIIQREEKGDFNDLRETATQFLDSIKTFEEYIDNVQGVMETEDLQITLDFVYDNLPLFLEGDDYKAIEGKLQKDSIQSITEKNYKNLISPTGIISRDIILKDPLGISFMGLKKLEKLQIDDNLIIKNGFLATKDQSKILLFISPSLSGSETKENTVFVEKLHRLKSHLNEQYKERSSVDYFGANLIAVANASQIKSDLLTTISLSIIVLMLVLIVYYRNVFIPLIVFVPTAFGALVALACVYFFLGTVSAISISIGAILLGVTVDYSLHILTHFKHNHNVKDLYENITKPVVMSSSTTAAAFLCLLFVESDVLKDLGVFAAVSVLASAFFALLLIPHLYRPKAKSGAIKNHFFDRLAAIKYHKKRGLVIASMLVVFVSLFVFNKLEFNNNISDLNYIPDELKTAEKKLEDATNLTSKSIYIAAYGNSAEEALQQNEAVSKYLDNALKEENIISFSSVSHVLMSKQQQQQKIDAWKNFWDAGRKNLLKEELTETGKTLGFKPTTHHLFYTQLDQNFELKDIQDFKTLPAAPVDEYVAQKEGFYTVTTIVKISDTQREKLFSDFKNTEGVLLIDRQEINEAFLGQLKNDFTDLVNYSLVVIVLLLWLFFKRIELVLVSIIPIIMTAIVTVGIFVMLGIQLNIFSLIVCTLIFGIGVDFSIFMTSALQKKYTGYKVKLATYKASILLAVITTTLAIGVLVFAKHPALKSISVASILGILTALAITFICYPFLFSFFFENRVKKGKSPVSIRLMLHSLFSFAYYGLGGLLIALFGPVYLWITPAKKKRKLHWFRVMISKFMKSVLGTNPFITKKIINPNGETFEKPAIIIANHTSFLDSLTVSMLSPKIIFLVNDWVYNSVFMGAAARISGFYPVSKGLDTGLEDLREKVQQGFSLMIFPEATRSRDNIVKRFHKGAFYLAEEFQLDILPVYIHGNSEICPKGDHIIYDGKITIVLGDRIKIDNPDFGGNYTQRTKTISKFFKNRFETIRKQEEDEDYFKKMILLSFLYKEKPVYNLVKTQFDRLKITFHKLNNHIPEKASILHLADDFGQWDVLMALQQPRRKIYSYITDPHKRAVAKTNYLIQKREIQYLETLQTLPAKAWDVLLITNESTSIEELNKLLSNIKSVILLHNFTLKSHLEASGFQVAHEGGFVVLKKIERA